jgi:outer membrane protein assembly factor BamB
LYVTLANPDHTYLIALDHDGGEVGRRDFGRWVSQHGFGASPIVFEDQVILFNSQQADQLPAGREPGKSELISVDRKTGKDRWRLPLVADRTCYAVPCVQMIDGKPHLIGCSSGEGFFVVDPTNGSIVDSKKVFKMRTVASPILADGLMMGSNGSGGGGNYLVAGRFENHEFQTAFEVNRNANYVSTPIVVDGLLFLFGDKGGGSCVDAKTGELHWRERLSKGFTGSPVAAAKHIYVVDSSGKALVIEANSEFKLVTEVELGEPTRATPAISGDQIFFRTNTKLFAVGS